MKSHNITISLLISFLITNSFAQRALTMEESVQLSLKNNLQIKSGEYEVEQFKQLKKTYADFGKTNVLWMHGNYNSVNTDNNITFSQSIPFPTTLMQQAKLGEAQAEGARLSLSITKNELIYNVRSTYLNLSYLSSLQQLLLSQDSLYSGFAKASSLRYSAGETNLLEKTTADLQQMEIKNQLKQNEAEILVYQMQLQVLMNSSDVIQTEDLAKLQLKDSSSVSQSPLLNYYKQQVVINQQTKKMERNRFLPDFTVGYFTQSLVGYQRVGTNEVFFDRSKKFSGFQIGVSVPIWFVSQAGRSKAAYYGEEAAKKKYEYTQLSIQVQLNQANQELAKNQINLSYYEKDALKNASLILQQAQKSFQSGDIGYIEYLQSVKSAQNIRAGYLLALNQYNQSIIRLKYLKGEN